MARRMVPQGAVLLRNESDVLPLPHGERVAVFGSGQLAFQPGGGGSGFLSHTPFSTPLDALRRESDSGSLLLEPETEKAYRTDRNLKVTPEFAKRARSGADTALIILSRFAEEGRDRSSGPGGWLLTPEEEEMFHSIRNAGFEKTVVILNTPGPIDTSFHVRFCQASFVTFFQFFLYSKHNSPYPCNHRCRFLPKSKLIVSLFLFFKKTFSSTSHRQRVSHRSQPSIDRERSRHSPIICHMRKTCEFEASVLRCRMQSATRSFIELPLCSKISFRSP